jgi:hypothetical protein
MGGGVIVDAPAHVAAEDLVLAARGAVIGQSRLATIDRVIYVVPAVYGQLPINDRYAVARVIGQITRLDGLPARGATIMLLGPGRWGTTTPSLGVPVQFSDINRVSVLCEIVAMRDDLVPDVSLGTHFFNEIVELDMLYLALFPAREGNQLNRAFFEQAPNRLAELAPDAQRWQHVVRVLDMPDPAGAVLRLNANTLTQRVVCYRERP